MNKLVQRQVRLVAAQIKDTSSTKLPCLLVTSVGNPEPQFKGTRHNVGHSVLSYLVQHDPRVSGHYQFSEADIFATSAQDTKPGIAYIRSNVFMNTSGHAVVRALKWFRQNYDPALYSPKLLIVHDDLELALGASKLRQMGKAVRGHNGLRSIAASVPDPYACLQVGIDRPDSKDSAVVAKYVLGKFSRQEQSVLHDQSLPLSHDLVTLLWKEINR